MCHGNIMKQGFCNEIRRKIYYLIELPIVRGFVKKLPISNNKILFDNFAGKGYGGNPKYIAEALLKSDFGNLDLVWLVDNSMPEDERKTFPDGIRVVNNESAKGLYERATDRKSVV